MARQNSVLSPADKRMISKLLQAGAPISSEEGETSSGNSFIANSDEESAGTQESPRQGKKDIEDSDGMLAASDGEEDLEEILQSPRNPKTRKAILLDSDDEADEGSAEPKDRLQNQELAPEERGRIGTRLSLLRRQEQQGPNPMSSEASDSAGVPLYAALEMRKRRLSGSLELAEDAVESPRRSQRQKRARPTVEELKQRQSLILNSAEDAQLSDAEQSESESMQEVAADDEDTSAQAFIDGDLDDRKRRADLAGMRLKEDAIMGSMELQDAFELYLRHLASCIAIEGWQDAFNKDANLAPVRAAVKKVERRLADMRDKCVTSEAWRGAVKGFIPALVSRPVLLIQDYHSGDEEHHRCEACRKHKSYASKTMTFSGQRYEPDWTYGSKLEEREGQRERNEWLQGISATSFVDDEQEGAEGEERPAQEAKQRVLSVATATPGPGQFLVGKDCAARVRLYHAFLHHKCHLLCTLRRQLQHIAPHIADAKQGERAVNKLLEDENLKKELFDQYDQMLDMAPGYLRGEEDTGSWKKKNAELRNKVDKLLAALQADAAAASLEGDLRPAQTPVRRAASPLHPGPSSTPRSAARGRRGMSSELVGRPQNQRSLHDVWLRKQPTPGSSGAARPPVPREDAPYVPPTASLVAPESVPPQTRAAARQLDLSNLAGHSDLSNLAGPSDQAVGDETQSAAGTSRPAEYTAADLQAIRASFADVARQARGLAEALDRTVQLIDAGPAHDQQSAEPWRDTVAGLQALVTALQKREGNIQAS